MRYRLTLECGLSALVDDAAYRHLLRQAVRHGDELTRVRGGYVVTAGRRMAALIVEERKTFCGQELCRST